MPSPTHLRRRASRGLALAAMLAAMTMLLLLAGRFDGQGDGEGASPPFSSHPVSAPRLSGTAAIALLDGLRPEDGADAPPYERDRFGPRWADVDQNGCDTRNDILARDLASPVFREGTRGCVVLEGTLVDPYDGRTELFTRGERTSPSVQIDHIVALAWAWRHGADGWSDDARIRFANDPANLVATADEVNAAKSADGPAQWLPPRAESVCGFVLAWVSIVHEYDLAIDAADRRAARGVLAGC